MATLAELIPVQCSCKAINRSSIKTVKMVTWRSNHTATALPDGTVLLTGGFLEGSAERFTPAF